MTTPTPGQAAAAVAAPPTPPELSRRAARVLTRGARDRAEAELFLAIAGLACGESVDTRRCAACRWVKPAAAFHWRGNNRDTRCGDCRSALKLRGGGVSSRTCSACGETKPVGEFNRAAADPVGRQRWCRDCANAAKRASHRHPVPPRLRPSVDTAAEWAELAAIGVTRREAAQRMGVSKDALDKAIARARAAGQEVP